eukprot:840739-Pleurochrysis_carterae.AAC.1
MLARLPASTVPLSMITISSSSSSWGTAYAAKGFWKGRREKVAGERERERARESGSESELAS